MSKPKTYKFRTFQELLDNVPAEKLQECCSELGTLFQSQKLMAELTWGVAENLAKADGKEFPPMPKTLLKLPDELEWIDDGKGEIEGKVMDKKGAGVYTLKVTKTKKAS